MKEYLSRGIEWISHNKLIESISDNEFVRGVVIGIIAGIVLLFVLRFIIWLFARRKACTVLHCTGKSGEISISSHAAASVIRHAADALECLEIIRIRIYRRAGKYDIDIRAKMDAGKGTALQLMDKLTLIVKNQMQQVFGISDVDKVKLIIASCCGTAGDVPAGSTLPDDVTAGDSLPEVSSEQSAGEKDEAAEKNN